MEMEEEEMSRMLDYLIESERNVVSLSRREAETLPEGYERCSLWIEIR